MGVSGASFNHDNWASGFGLGPNPPTTSWASGYGRGSKSTHHQLGLRLWARPKSTQVSLVLHPRPRRSPPQHVRFGGTATATAVAVFPKITPPILKRVSHALLLPTTVRIYRWHDPSRRFFFFFLIIRIMLLQIYRISKYSIYSPEAVLSL